MDAKFTLEQPHRRLGMGNGAQTGGLLQKLVAMWESPWEFCKTLGTASGTILYSGRDAKCAPPGISETVQRSRLLSRRDKAEFDIWVRRRVM